MATWQHNLQIEPAVGSTLDAQAVRALVAMVEAVLPRKKSWSEEITQCGEIDSTVVEVMWDDGAPISISFRVDVSREWEGLVVQTWQFCKSAGFVIRSEDGSAFVDLAHLLREVRAGDACRFVRDPRRFLEGLSRESE